MMATICAALRRDLGLRFGKRLGVGAAIRAPMAAVEGDGGFPLYLVRESEIRHGIADLWCRSADIGCRQPHHQAIHGVLHRRAQSARRGREHVEPLAQGAPCHGNRGMPLRAYGRLEWCSNCSDRANLTAAPDTRAGRHAPA
jgi:hypothetical protein